MNNQVIIEKLYKLQLAVQDKNHAVYRALEKALIPLLEFDSPLDGAKKSELLKLKGVGARTVEFIERIIGGDCVHKIACDVPVIQKPQDERNQFRKAKIKRTRFPRF